VIIDLERFVTVERAYWSELESMLNHLEDDVHARLDLAQAKRLHYLYQRASADLAQITTFAAEPETRRYLELLVSRAYGEIHETRDKPHRLAFFKWLFETFPQTFRRNINAFWLSLAVTVAGCGFGGMAVSFDPDAKAVILPFAHLLGNPSERVAEEERASKDRLAGFKATFSTTLMTHNTKVSVLLLALGMTWGIGTMIVLFYNGIILGAVSFDYIAAGETKFLAGWLLPHGAVEIPAILIAGQAGLLLAGALIGRASKASITTRLRQVTPDLVTLIGGVGLLLVWAGLVEAFLSQYHEPIIPYGLKIGFGVVELALLTCFLARSGLSSQSPAA
jgi:uncharacterized membrane protein SpoIIM required for sporulation